MGVYNCDMEKNKEEVLCLQKKHKRNNALEIRKTSVKSFYNVG